MNIVKIIMTICMFFLFSGQAKSELNVRDFDLTDFKLGMTPDEVEAIALREGLNKNNERYLTIRGDHGNPFLISKTWVNRRTLGSYSFEFTRPPSEPQVKLIRREFVAQSVPAASIHEDLVSKYGEPTNLREAGTGAFYVWYQGGDEISDRCLTAQPRTAGSKNCTGAQMRVTMTVRNGQSQKIGIMREASLADYSLIMNDQSDFDEYAESVLRRLEEERMEAAETPRL